MQSSSKRAMKASSKCTRTELLCAACVARLLIATAVICVQIPADAQTATTEDPHFEVASIKPSSESHGPTLYNPTRERFVASNITAKGLIAYAYDVREFQISGGPRWLENDQYDIIAKPQGDVGGERIMAMVRNLLIERFSLKLHRESKELPVFALVAAKSGPKLHVSAGEGLDVRGGHGHFTARGITMQMMAAQLASRVLDRPVVDRTGLNGVFDVELEWAADDNPDAGPSIFTAIQEQLGLRLEAQRAAVDVLVVDQVDRPSAN